jgi:hypothetical protein
VNIIDFTKDVPLNWHLKHGGFLYQINYGNNIIIFKTEMPCAHAPAVCVWYRTEYRNKRK